MTGRAQGDRTLPVAGVYRHRVCPAEVDGFHVVHFSNYFRWLSAALFDWFDAAGLGPGRFCNGTVEVRIGRAQAAYVSSARLGDDIEATVGRVVLEERRLMLCCTIRCSRGYLVRGRLTLAFINATTGALTLIPDEVREALRARSVQ
jgi:acyl-CoA thioesterase FadM